MKPTEVLFITTSHDKLGDTNDKTGVWMEGLGSPYYVFKDAGAEVLFLLESKLLSLGALYSKGENYVSHIVEDGNIITGQNPASSKETARRIMAWVQRNKLIDKLQLASAE
jgi:putative intracellular protease/amidase